MGCCVSTKSNTTSPAPKTPQISARQNGSSKSPPPTYEEETVKEVLSETPTIPRFHESASLKPDVFSRTADEKKHHQNGDFFKKPFIAYRNDELSEVESEICSTHSEGVSVSTALTEKMENKGDCNDEFRETQRRSPARFKNQPFSGEVKRENTVGRSPGRRSDPSPSRNRHGPCYGRRMDSGESSGRRSRSPVIRADSW